MSGGGMQGGASVNQPQMQNHGMQAQPYGQYSGMFQSQVQRHQQPMQAAQPMPVQPTTPTQPQLNLGSLGPALQNFFQNNRQFMPTQQPGQPASPAGQGGFGHTVAEPTHGGK